MKRIMISFPSTVLFLTLGCVVVLAFQTKRPIDQVNALVGTAPLDDPKLIGNAPPPGKNCTPE